MNVSLRAQSTLRYRLGKNDSGRVLRAVAPSSLPTGAPKARGLGACVLYPGDDIIPVLLTAALLSARLIDEHSHGNVNFRVG